MSRYWDDGDDGGIPAELWEANLARALKGKRGQKALAELREALLALPEHALISGALCTVNSGKRREDMGRWVPWPLDDGQPEGVCLVGAYAWHRKVKAGADPAEAFDSLPTLDDENHDMYETAELGVQAGLTFTLAYDLAFKNDEWWASCTPGERWQKALAWIDEVLARSAA